MTYIYEYDTIKTIVFFSNSKKQTKIDSPFFHVPHAIGFIFVSRKRVL